MSVSNSSDSHKHVWSLDLTSNATEFLDLRSHVWGIRKWVKHLGYLPDFTFPRRTRLARDSQEGQYLSSHLIPVESLNRPADCAVQRPLSVEAPFGDVNSAPARRWH